MKILVIIVTYNGSRWVEKCLGSLASSTIVPDIFILDNMSTDDTLDKINCFCAEHTEIKFTLQSSSTNLGFAAANNRGFEYAVQEGYDYVYLLNQDAWVMPDTYELLIEAAEKNPDFGLLSPVQMNASLSLPDSNFAKYNPEAATSTGLVPSKFFPAAHWLIPVWALKTVGAFSPTFHHYGEDNNWIDRLHYHGLKSGVVGSAKAVHDRENRQSSMEYRMQRKCLLPVISLSNPSGCFLMKCLTAPLWLIGCGIKNLSLIPVKSIPSLFKRLKEIKTNRTFSKVKGAFLTDELVENSVE